MKFTITMKDPDGFENSLQEAVNEQLEALDLPEDEKDALREVKTEKLRENLRKWFEYSEYLTVEVDTDKGTCTVVPR